MTVVVLCGDSGKFPVVPLDLIIPGGVMMRNCFGQKNRSARAHLNHPAYIDTVFLKWDDVRFPESLVDTIFPAEFFKFLQDIAKWFAKEVIRII